MNARAAVACLLVVSIGVAASAAFIDSVGVRLYIPMGNQPFLIGLEVVNETDVGVISGTFSLNHIGQALFLGSLDIPLSSEKTGLYARLTGGLTYFDPTSLYPLPLVGGGMAYRDVLFEVASVGLSGEIIYPFALIRPLFSLSGGWSLK